MHGAYRQIAAVFGTLVDLQPIAWIDDGLLCAPRIAPDTAAAALARCPLPTSGAHVSVRIPDSPSRLVAGWYRRTPLHAPAPPGVRELVQVTGEGFGPHDHPTTAMCLAAIDQLAPGPALDIGCGSGLLIQAWRASGRGTVDAIDADPAAVEQARASLHAAGLTDGWTCSVGRIEVLDPTLLATSTILANLPPVAHAALMRRLSLPPPAAVVSGTSRTDARVIVNHLRALGMRLVRTTRRDRYVCATLVRA